VNETAVRHPNRFLADLMVTMRSAAETARRETLEQCRTDAEVYTREIHVRSEERAASMRATADTDVEAIREWSRLEMERIRVETESRIAARGAALDSELGGVDSTVAVEIARVDSLVRDFERDVAEFCDRLLNEPDPATFASMAAQMPDVPLFEPEAEAVAEPASGPEPEAIVAIVADPEPGSEPEPEQQSVAIPIEVFPATMSLAAPRPEPMRAGAPTPADAVPPTVTPVATAVATPDEPELDEDRIGARLAGIRGAAAAVARESTQVVVVGLVSVASIATFKRQLSRLQGIRSVAVSSGPDGEFVFTVGHSRDTSLADLIPAMPGFQARVVSQRDGVLDISAHDPETEG
jgi:hypothetical protein